MDRYWLLTSTTYGTWLPGNNHGFVGRVWDRRQDDPRKNRIAHRDAGTEYDFALPGLFTASAALLKSPPVYFEARHAAIVMAQIIDKAQYRGWELCAAAVMFNHVHIVVGVPGDPDPDKVLGEFKSRASRELNRTFGKPAGEWWTHRGSTRKLPDDAAVTAAVEYVLHKQPNPLAVGPTDR